MNDMMHDRSLATHPLSWAVAGLILFFNCHTAMAMDLNALWDFSKPELSEQRFVAAQQGASEDERRILQTQIARTHGLRRDFVRARELLAPLKDLLPQASPELRVRYHLEMGRTFASPAHPEALRTLQARETAREHYTQAFEQARAARLDALAIDVLHMMVMVDPEPDQQLAWNEKALAYMAASDQPDAQRWEGSLRNNVGYALHLKGEYDAALQQFQRSRAAYARDGRERNVRISDWMIAWTLRAQHKDDEALAIQLALEKAWDADGDPDPEVYEELAHLYRARGDEARARHYEDKRKALAP